MHGDCATNHIKCNGNDIVDCFVINFILQNNDWWKGNGKINDFVNVSYQAKVESKPKTFLSEANETTKVWTKINEVHKI